MKGTIDARAAAPASPAGAAGALAADRKRSAWWRVHQWAGLQLSLFLTFVFVTGTLAVFSYELDWLARPAMWAAPTAVEERAPWGDVARAAKDHAPDASIAVIYAPLHPAATFDVIMSDDRRTFHVYVHPRTGEVTGVGAWAGIQRFLRNTHRHLMLPVKWGVSLVGLSAVALAVSLVTSFWVYKKWWRGFFRWPRGRTARAFVGDLHRFAGLWSVWFVLLMIATGVWYVVEQWGGAAPASNPARPPAALAEAQPDLPALASPFDAVNRAAAELANVRPDFRITQIIWPDGPDELVQLQGEASRAILVRPRANVVWADPATGAILGQADPARLSAHVRIAEAADPLHFGTFGGYMTKTLWFLFGVALSGLAMTGVIIYALRLAKASRQPAGWRQGLAAGWSAMGPARWVAALMVIIPVALAPFVL